MIFHFGTLRVAFAFAGRGRLEVGLFERFIETVIVVAGAGSELHPFLYVQ